LDWFGLDLHKINNKLMKNIQEKISAIYQSLKAYASKLRIFSVGGQFLKRTKPEFIFLNIEELLKFVEKTFLKNMLKKTKKGNVSESISDGIFDRIGFTTNISREDDYGIDFLCSVGKDYGDSIYPTKTFITQLKSNFNDIDYDLTIIDKNKWLVENNIPLFFCVYTEKEGNLYFYSTSMINDFNIRQYKNINKIRFKLREPNEELCRIDLHGLLPLNATVYEIDCGIPFLKISVLETIEDNKIEFDNYRIILEKIIKKENENIVYRNIGLPFFSWLHQYKTNDLNILFGWADYSDDFIIKGDELLNKLYQPILTLCNTYYHEGQSDKFEKLKSFVELIEYNDKTKSVLEALGYRDKNGQTISKVIP
jgi:hypothetical protein